jgi:hypothetical protein
MENNEARERGDLRWRVESTGDSSARFGPCEQCEKNCPDVHLMSIDKLCISRFDGRKFWGHVRTVFGHEDCLERYVQEWAGAEGVTATKWVRERTKGGNE